MPGTFPGKLPAGKRQVTVGVQTGGVPQRVRRQVTLEHVVAGDVKDILAINPWKQKRPPILPGGRKDDYTTIA